MLLIPSRAVIDTGKEQRVITALLQIVGGDKLIIPFC